MGITCLSCVQQVQLRVFSLNGGTVPLFKADEG